MSADPQLAKEIEYDLRKFEEQQEEERLAQETRSAGNTPTRVKKKHIGDLFISGIFSFKHVLELI
jgi:hypothetical protein